jgi:hypothetical protein
MLLEAKIRQYETSVDQTSVNPEVQRLMKENDLLKRLLNTMGLGADFLTAYDKASKLAPEISKAAIQPNEQSCRQNASCKSLENTKTTTLSMSVDRTLPDQLSVVEDFLPTETLFSWDSAIDVPRSPRASLGAIPENESGVWENFILPGTYESNAEATLTSEKSENTTLCSIAFSMIMKNNRKGYDAAELDLKLRAGYRNCIMWSDGCRIENKTLFKVLAEIS